MWDLHFNKQGNIMKKQVLFVFMVMTFMLFSSMAFAFGDESKFENDDINAPWNNILKKDDLFAPWNDPLQRDDIRAPWNNRFASEEDTNEYMRENDVSSDYYWD